MAVPSVIVANSLRISGVGLGRIASSAPRRSIGRALPSFVTQRPQTACGDIQSFFRNSGIAQTVLPVFSAALLCVTPNYVAWSSMGACGGLFLAGITSVCVCTSSVFRVSKQLTKLNLPPVLRRRLVHLCRTYLLILLTSLLTTLGALGHTFAVFALEPHHRDSAYVSLFVCLLLLFTSGPPLYDVAMILRYFPAAFVAQRDAHSKPPPRYRRGSFMDVVSVVGDPETASLVNGAAPSPFPPTYAKVAALKTGPMDYLNPPRRMHTTIEEDEFP